MTSESTYDWLKTWIARSFEPAPTAFDTSVVAPTPSICVSARTMNIRFPANPTAAMASFPSLPTKYRSARK